MLALSGANLYEAEIDQRLRDLAILRVAHLNGSHYVWVQHATFAVSLGVSAEQVDAVPRGADAEVFTEVEKLALRFTDEMTENVKVSAATFHALAQHLNACCFMELAIGIGSQSSCGERRAMKSSAVGNIMKVCPSLPFERRQPCPIGHGHDTTRIS